MKTLLMILALTCFIGSVNYAQKQSFTVKQGSIVKGRTLPSNFLGKIDGKFYLIASKYGAFGVSGGPRIEVYDANMNFVELTEIDIFNGDEELDDVYIRIIGNKIWQFGSNLDKKKGKNTLYAREIDKKNLEKENKWKKLAESSFKKKSNAGDFNILVSNNDSMIGIIANLEYKKGEKEKYKMIVYDQEMNQLWDQNVTLPYNDEEFYTQSLLIGNNGKIYLHGEVAPIKLKRKDKEKGKTSSKAKPGHYILTFSDGLEEPNTYKVDLKNKFIVDLKLKIDDEENLICAGFYSKKSEYSMDGTYYIKIDDKNYNVLASTYKEFDLKFITLYKSERSKKKASKKQSKGEDQEESFYDIRELYISSDGSATLLAEEHYTYTVCTSSPNGGTTCRTYYVYNNIIVVQFNVNGEVKYTRKINKTSNQGSPMFLGFNSAIYNDKIYIVYNDNMKNDMEKDPDDYAMYTNPRKSSVILYQIEEDGNMDRIKLFDTKKGGNIIYPMVQFLDENKLYMYAQRGKKHNLVELTLGKK